MKKGRVHSFQSMGTLDGPGVRYVVFMQGCNLRCRCCHNPDTWDMESGKLFTADEIISKMLRFREYFGKEGGITVSGGEPLLQAEFVTELFKLSKQENVNTCLDTSGSILNDACKNLLLYTDRVLLDIKYTSDELYRENVGCSFSKTMEFLSYLNKNSIPTTLRQVIIPGINNTDDNILKLKSIANHHPCVDKTELLPFRKICITKYNNMNIKFPFEHIPEPSKEEMKRLNAVLESGF